MIKNMQNYFSTGEFAKLLGVTKDTLFHYEKIGIFSPDVKDSNGYRYYSPYQAEVFYVIDTLKFLGMPLKEIKEYLDIRSPLELIKLLEKEEELITEKVTHLKKVKNLISQKKALTRSVIGLNTQGITLEKRDTEDYLIITETVPFLCNKNTIVTMANHYAYLDEHDIYSPYSLGYMTKYDGKSLNDDDSFDYFFTKVSKSSGGHNFIRPKGTYLTAYHTEGYASIIDSYHKLVEYAAAEKINIKDFFYEDVLLDELSVKGYEKYLIKLSILTDL